MGIIQAIPGVDGSSIIGSRNRELGPCNMYMRTSRKPNLSGTVTNISSALIGTVESVAGLKTSTVTGSGTAFTTDFQIGNWIKIDTTVCKVLAINSNTELIIDKLVTAPALSDYYKFLATVTGSGTSFQSELAVGDYISVGSLNAIAKVLAITSNTQLTIQSVSIAAEGNTYRKTNAIFLGGTDATTLKFGTSKAELKDSQYGESPADKGVTGASCSIEAGLSQASLERIEAVTQGFELERDGSGNIIGYYFGVSLGEMDSDIWDQVTLVKIVRGIESSNPLHILHFPLAAANVEAEAKYDAASQRFYKTMFTCYRSDEYLSPTGRALFFYSEGMF